MLKLGSEATLQLKCIQNDLFDSPGACGSLDSMIEGGKPEDKEQLAEVRLTEVIITI